MLRQWERGFDDQLLHEIIKYVHKSFTKKVSIITPNFFNRRRLSGVKDHCAVIVHEKNLLISVFWCDDPNYLFNRYPISAFQLIT